MIDGLLYTALRTQLEVALAPQWELCDFAHRNGEFRISACRPGRLMGTLTEYKEQFDLHNIFNHHDCMRLIQEATQRAVEHFHKFDTHQGIADRAELASNA